MPRMLACDGSSFEGTLSKIPESSELNRPRDSCETLNGSGANTRDMMSEWIELQLIKTYF